MFPRRVSKSQPPRVEMPITPMLDLTFQLLFFFIINYNPTPLEGQMDMALPAKPEYAAQNQQNVQKSNESAEEELPADLTLVLRTQNRGAADDGLIITQLVVEDRSGPTDLAEKYKDQPALRGNLLAALKAHLE